MMQMRARGFALRDAFPDVLKGLITAEEAQDFPDQDKPARVASLPKPRNPLEALPVSEITQDVEQTVEDTEAAHQAQVEEINQQLQAAGIEVVEIKDYTWALGIPGRPDLPCEGYDDWARQYEEMANKVAKSKLAPEAKLAKLEEFKKYNQRIFSMLKIEQSLQHTKAMVTRRSQIEAEAQ
jgi:hypothetical protein